MKKQIRRISKIATPFSAFLLVIGLLTPIQATAQTNKAPSPYYLMFEVTIKGAGSTEDGTSWSVDRTYESIGLIELKTRGPLIIPSMSQEQLKKEILGGGDPLNRLAFGVPLRITIKDSFESVTIEPCPSVNGKEAFTETTFITKTWEGSGVVRSTATTGIKRFRVHTDDSSDAFYNVYIPVFAPETSAKPLVYIKETAITRKPKAKVIEMKSLSAIQVPVVDGILEYPAIHHEKDPLLNIVLTEIDYDHSHTPSEPLIEKIPDSQSKSIVRIRYRFSSSRFTNLPDTKK